MKVHVFEYADLRILASFAIDLYTDHLFFKVFKVVNTKENYWSYSCRFAVSEKEIETYYDALNFDCGRDNEPDTYQMSWHIMKNGVSTQRPICSPLLVVHYFEELCKKQAITMN